MNRRSILALLLIIALMAVTVAPAFADSDRRAKPEPIPCSLSKRIWYGCDTPPQNNETHPRTPSHER